MGAFWIASAPSGSAGSHTVPWCHPALLYWVWGCHLSVPVSYRKQSWVPFVWGYLYSWRLFRGHSLLGGVQGRALLWGNLTIVGGVRRDAAVGAVPRMSNLGVGEDA